MKIALITFHHVINYGSALQSYATQTVFEQLGNQVEVIDYVNNVNRDNLLLKNRVKESRFDTIPILRQVYMAFQWYDMHKMSKVFNRFWKEHLHLTSRFYSSEEIKNGLQKKYDAYCTGSDQVWNTHVSPNSIGIDPAFYLDFAPEESFRFSYSASFGMDSISDKERPSIYGYLQKYQYLSVRERVGLRILKDMGFDDAVQLLDPTFLLKPEDWAKMAKSYRRPEHYIFTYQLHKNPEMKTYISKISQELRLPVVNVSFSWRGYLQSKYAAYGVSPEQFLYLLKNADYVITDSFHATSFSILFEKKFVSIYSDAFSNRMQSILELTGLDERHLSDYSDIALLTKSIDYKKAKVELSTERERAIQWIKSVFAKIYDKG